MAMKCYIKKKRQSKGNDSQTTNQHQVINDNLYSVTFFLIIIATIMCDVMSRDNSDSANNTWYGLCAVVATYCIISALTFQNGPFTRPHPAVWRMLFGLSVLYLILLVFMTFLNLQQVNAIMEWLDPNVKHAKREVDVVEEYAANCSIITLDRIYSMCDIFALGHIWGWTMKALILRSYVLCWTISIAWELTELFFMHIMPNFQECWWDQIFYDVVICNGIGIFIGIRISRYFEMKEYRWEITETATGNLQRNGMQFTPTNWKLMRYLKPETKLTRILGVYTLLLLWLLSELNAFFLKHVLRFPATHPFCWARLPLMYLFSGPAISQHYDYWKNPCGKKIGYNMCVQVATVFIETIVSLKFGYEEFKETKFLNIFGWLVLLGVLTVVILYWGMLTTNYSHNKVEELHDEDISDSGVDDKMPEEVESSNEEENESQRSHDDYSYRLHSTPRRRRV